ncbi:MAG TPA: 2-oxoglutarate dehydrogenase E1 component [Aliidongia sp.]|uniref:2-oxoglutarate dehydrogenase E1 component n=1 Tax=Aliidongia sp. TaxID=1914230 RepID=UPI002DDCCEB2|nr:2-oxoglutarate dehydrogenase E1 component [Aliidongia sp.]HEV2678415.1 2-oxoglutarate dehydrogenase E1 component [Aliidongia sp.]
MLNASSPLAAVSADYLAMLEDRYDTDPGSIEPGWRVVFDLLRDVDAGAPSRSGAALMAAIAAYRDRGHRQADLDPLGLAVPSGLSELDPARLARIVAAVTQAVQTPAGEAAAIERFRSTYCGTLAVEAAHIDDPTVRDWIQDAFESRSPAPDIAARRRALDLLTAAEEFERFMALKFPTKKRFGAEGAEALVPLLDRLLRNAAQAGVTEVVIGTMHRGRLNIAANVLGKPLVQLLAEFKGSFPFAGDPVAADVPYHLGHEADLLFDGRPLRVTLAPNPSHLEAVKPVVLGRVRARQDLAEDPRRILCVLIHTDASVVGQGIVAETLQLGGVAGFTTAGTVHIVVNNQIGFTTERAEARTSLHCTGPWKAVDSLILHANGDDPDATLRAADLAVAFRQAHGRDAVIDLVCYRRNGHNEIDEPRFTQPLLYRVIDEHPTVTAQFAARLTAEGVVSADGVAASVVRSQATLHQAFAAAAAYRPNHSGLLDAPSAEGAQPSTGIAEARLHDLLSVLASPPDDMNFDKKIERIVRQRGQAAETGVPWAVAEALAFGSLLTEGAAIRLSGQDVVRGAFSHRHFALTDNETGRRHVSLGHVEAVQARFTAINSPLSEYAVLGFEYGYSLERPDALTIWEAQFGDFANGAQIVIDQFVASGEEKWRQSSGLVLLLPHGLEGQGPEHSSARIERFLQLAARDNIQIAHPSTPANYFHLLRRQARATRQKPLIVMSPKTLLRLPAAVSAMAAFGPGSAFQPVIASSLGASARAVLLCSGKIAYELERERDRVGAEDLAIVRLEQLYPLPTSALLAIFVEWRAARFAWVQEEPSNMGAWSYLDRRLEALLEQAGAQYARTAVIARPESPSPAGSFHGDHDRDQSRLVEQAFAWAAG